MVNQNYIRNSSSGAHAPIQFNNNVLHSIQDVTGGLIANNILRHNSLHWVDYWNTNFPLWNINSTSIKNNVLIEPFSIHYGSNCVVINNMLASAWGDNPVIVSDWNDALIKFDLGVSPLCDYHLKSTIGKNAGSDGTDIGVYGGTGFSDTALPPYPQIVFKNIPAQTDEYGNLKIQIKVKAQ